MSRILEPGDRPGAWNTTGDLVRRVGKLEAVPGATTAKKLLVCWGGALPTVTGNGLVWRIPYDSDGSTLTFTLASAFARIEGTSANSVVFVIEKASGGDVAFSASTVTTITVLAGDYESENTGLSTSISSGDLVRLVFSAVAVSPVNFNVELIGSE